MTTFAELAGEEGIDEAEAVAALWGDTRLAVVDVETVTHDDELHPVSVAVVTCRAGYVRGVWQTLIDPQVPVDADSAHIHGLTDDHLAGEPTFAQVADLIEGALTPAAGEPLLFVSHNVNFDAGVLRAAFDRCGRSIPALPILDTAKGLARSVGVHPADRSLMALCGALGIVHDRPHASVSDAVVCAEAVVELLRRAAIGGERNLHALSHDLSGGLTTRTVRAVDAKMLRRRVLTKTLPAAHVASHRTLLPARAGTRMLREWTDGVAECAALRCRHLADRVANAGPAPARLIDPLESVLDACLADGDTAGAATVLHALLPILHHLPARSGRLGFRNAQLAWAKRWGPRFDAAGRCPDDDRCPACRQHETCALDRWADVVGAAALGDPARYAAGFFETKGKAAGTGAWTTWRRQGLEAVADAALWCCVEHWRATGFPSRAEQAIARAWRAGCRHPHVADAYAGAVAASNRPDAIRAALTLTTATLTRSGGSTHEGWTRLRARTMQLGGLLRRREGRPSGRFDADGNPIPKRRHHPTNPKRTRRTRFTP